MDVLVLIQAGKDGDGPDLLRWLKSDPVAAHAKLSAAPAASDDDGMGAAEVVQAVVDNATAIGGLVMSTVAWWDARRNARSSGAQSGVRIECNGAVVTINTSDPAKVQEVIDTLKRTEQPRGGGNSNAS
ncbi:effector-associated constant component EACC1 [Streptomyces umbrinus]|uniref:effector-associated constant component EACC1 n=1 Tax=Streptomyces umbrinus TaxID=67370 RepID=UPI00340566AF